MRNLALIAVAFTLSACSPPAPPNSEAPQPSAPQTAACNDVAPDLARAVRIEDAPPVAAAAADLRGGQITPGTYDLASAMRVGAATGWQGERAVALAVSENPDGGVVFNWAGAAAGEVDRWTADFAEAPEVRLTYTCGRMGVVPGAFSADDRQLRLRLTDGASGSLDLVFNRRS